MKFTKGNTKTTFAIFLLYLLFFSNFLLAQDESKIYQFDDKDAVHWVTLKNGNVLKGKVLRIPDKYRGDAIVTILFQGEEVTVLYRQIRKIEVSGPGIADPISQYYPAPGGMGFRPSNLFSSSTAIPMQKGRKELRAHVPTAAVILQGEFGLGAGFSTTLGFTIPGAVFLLQGKYAVKVANDFYLGAGATIGTSLAFLSESAGVVYGMATIGNERSFFNLMAGTSLFPDGGEVFLLFPGFSAKIGRNLRLGFEAFVISENGEIHLPYALPTLGWKFKRGRGGIDLGSVVIPDFFGDRDLDILVIPVGTLYFQF